MRKYRKFYYLFCLILLVNSFAAAKEEIVIESQLFKGIREEGKPGPEVIISSYSEPFIVPIHPSKIESESEFFTYLKKELNNVYQLKDIDLLATAKMIWDGKKKKLNETILFEEVCYSINLSPQMLSQNDINLRIVISKFKADVISLAADEIQIVGKGKERVGVFKNVSKMELTEAEMEKALDTEFAVIFGEPVVLGFSSNGQPYFLSLLINRREVKDVDRGVVSKEVLGGVVGGVIGSIQAKDPVCGKWVGRGAGYEKENRAVATYKYKGETYFFCSKECLEKFKENPEKYLEKDIKKPRDKLAKAEILTEPPKPVYHINPIYPDRCKKEMIQGMVTLEITIDKEGKVGRIKVLNSPHPDLSQAAIDAIKQWKYEIVIMDGKRVPAVFPVTIHFKLK